MHVKRQLPLWYAVCAHREVIGPIEQDELMSDIEDLLAVRV